MEGKVFNVERIIAYLLTNIRSIYSSFDKAHDTRHFDEVWDAVIRIVNCNGMNEWEKIILLTAAAYHDTGRMIDQDDHENFSSIIFKNDRNITRFFNYNEIQLISAIILEHRSKKIATTEYSKIIKDADKVMTWYDNRRSIYKPVAYNSDHYPELACNEEALLKRVKNIFERKFIDVESEWNSEYTIKAFYSKKDKKKRIPTDEEILDVIKEYKQEIAAAKNLVIN